MVKFSDSIHFGKQQTTRWKTKAYQSYTRRVD
jgi:hypothetical protein